MVSPNVAAEIVEALELVTADDEKPAPEAQSDALRSVAGGGSVAVGKLVSRAA